MNFMKMYELEDGVSSGPTTSEWCFSIGSFYLWTFVLDSQIKSSDSFINI